MSRQSPAVGRIVSVLNFFVEHPQQSFTLTQIVNALRLSRATCHALLMSLVEADYLYRNPDKSYVLGPALISLAVNAQNQFSPLTVARQEMRALADELDVLVSALVLEGDEVVARERAASRTHLGWAPSSPRSYPIHPWGSAFFMPLSDAELETELDKVKPPLSEKARDDVRKAVRFGRRYQFITAMSEPELKNAPSWTPQGRFVDDLPGDGVHEVRFISAPVLDQRGRVPLSLALYGFNHPMTHDEILATGERLRAVCGRIKKFMFGGALEPR
jgi:DNA-binding IclR family transcriptional regulator